MNRLSLSIKFIATLVLLGLGVVVYGQAAPAGQAPKGFTLDTNTLLIIFAVFLLLPIWILSNTFIAAARRHYGERMKTGMRILLPLAILLTTGQLMAQSATTPVASTPGLSSNAMTILLLCVIGAELLLILFFAHKTNDFIQKIESKGVSPSRDQDLFSWLKVQWSKMNFKPIEEEYKIDTGHSYDGIRELDNVIPPWFTTAFIISIIFAIAYLYRYHIAKSAPMQIEEFEIAMAKAELEHDEYLKTVASNIDESNIAVMTGADLEAGQKTFVTLCAACHKTDGGGSVGPNLTDEYWIHGGSLQDVFKTVKYGVPDKGMISWKEQLSPMQMAQVSNYIMTLKGTNPPGAKEKQGVLYVPAATPPDSTAVTTTPADTTTAR